jgi:hypothetical protein
MRRTALAIAAALVLSAGITAAQRKPAPRKPSGQKPLQTEAAKVQCREPLGVGLRTSATYCFVLAGNDPAQGVIVNVPPHTGPATLTFTLHNRHTFSEEDIKAGRAFAQYRAGIGVLTMTGELLGRGAVQSEFRKADDLFERIGGGASPRGVKAVAPIGNESVMVTIPAAITQVSLLGEVLEALTFIGRETATPGRPVAIVSNLQVEYRPK